jgi:hypothetical protein
MITTAKAPEAVQQETEAPMAEFDISAGSLRALAAEYAGPEEEPGAPTVEPDVKPGTKPVPTPDKAPKHVPGTDPLPEGEPVPDQCPIRQ